MQKDDPEIEKFIANASLLDELMNHHGWPVYESLIADLRLKRLEELAHEHDPANIRAIQGAAQALGDLLSLPYEIREQAAVTKRNLTTDRPHMTMDELRDALGLHASTDEV